MGAKKSMPTISRKSGCPGVPVPVSATFCRMSGQAAETSGSARTVSRSPSSRLGPDPITLSSASPLTAFTEPLNAASALRLMVWMLTTDATPSATPNVVRA